MTTCLYSGGFFFFFLLIFITMANANSTEFWLAISKCLLVLMCGSIWDGYKILLLRNFQLSSGFAVAEATDCIDSMFSKLFYECKEYVIRSCEGDLCNTNIDDLCEVLFISLRGIVYILAFTFQFPTILKWYKAYLDVPQFLNDKIFSFWNWKICISDPCSGIERAKDFTNLLI